MITPPSRPAHNFGYTVTDLEQSYTPPLLGTLTTATNYSYNLDKQLIQIVRPDAATINFNYDSGGRLSNITIPTGQITYAYNATTGNISTITAPNGGVLTYGYDGGLVTSSTWSGTVSGNISRTYDNNFRVTSDNINGGQSVAYNYDNDGLLTHAGSLAISRNLQNGLITGTTLGSLTDAYSYSVFGEVIGYQASFGTTSYKNIQYTRDNLGRITQKIEDGNTYAYNYDLAGRLTDVSLNGANQAHYTYDGNSNRLSVTTPGGTVNGTYDAQDRLISYGANSYAYTNNGELLTKTNASGTISYSYDVLGNLTHVALPNGTPVDYIVDGQNRRIGKKINGAVLEGYLYSDQLRIIATLDMNNAIVSRFIYGSKSNIPDYMVKAGNNYRIISDHLGSPRLVINLADGTIAEAIQYDEFGNITSDTNPGFIPFGFAGGLYDPYTGLTRFGARDYDPQTGRWTSKDPIRFGGGDTNLFGYATNDPVNFIDPLGLWGFGVSGSGSVEGGAGAIGAGGTVSAGWGVFGGGSQGINTGGFFSSGAFVGGPEWGSSLPKGDNNNFAVGGYAGGGVGFFLTNVNCASALKESFDTYSYNIGIKGIPWLNLSIQYGYSNGNWILNIVPPSPFSRGEGHSVSRYPTYSWTTP